MTEYDYSPAAWEHYLAQQARVSNWVSQTTAQAHSYSNPFVMSPTLRDRSFYDDELNGRWQRPTPSRSKTYNIPPTRQEDPYRHTSSRSRSGSHSQPVEVWSYPHSSRTTIQTASHSRTSPARKPPSRSQTIQAIYPPAAAPTHHYERTQPYPYPQKQSQPVRQHTSPAYYYPEQSHGHGSHQRTMYHSPSRPSQSYHHAPSGRLEYHYGPPAQKKPQPLFKRLLGFMSPGTGNGRGGPAKHRSSGRRSSY